MEFVEKAQTLLVENAMYVGVGLLLTVLLAAAVWYYMSRGSSSSGTSSGLKNVLMNQARMNEVTTDVPSMATQPDPVSPPQPTQSQEELERQLASIGNAADSQNE